VYLYTLLITYGYRTLEGNQPVLNRASMTYSAVSHCTTMVKVLPHVMRSINELNIPAGNRHGFEILYFGVNLVLMLDYRLSFNIEINGSNNEDQIELIIISRKDVSTWKNNGDPHHNDSSTSNVIIHYRNNGRKINDVFRPTMSDAYAFILNNRFSPSTSQKSRTHAVMVTLTHRWQQEVKESQLKNWL
jgi:hypothetical protein